MSELWYYVDTKRAAVGPITVSELVQKLRSQSDWINILVWKEGLADWKRAGDIADLKEWMVTPPPVPGSQPPPPVPNSLPILEMPKWQVRWWWYLAVFLCFSSITNWDGRKAMAWAALDRARRKNPDYNVAKAIERINWRFERKTEWRAPRNIVILSAALLGSIIVNFQNMHTIRDLILGLVGGLFLGIIIVGITDAIVRSNRAPHP
jgi:hypothetical protein